MNPRRLLVEKATDWINAIRSLPNPHILQSWLWGEVKADFGWRPERYLWLDADDRPLAAAQVLQRELRLRGTAMTVQYCPKGPLLDWAQTDLAGWVLDDLAALARSRSSLQIKIDPDVTLAVGVPGEADDAFVDSGQRLARLLGQRGWRASPEQIQFRNTMIVDLTRSEDELLAGMKQKSRYNLRLAGRRGVSVRRGSGDDLDLLSQMYAHTAVRDEFTIREEDYYRTVWGRFLEAGLAQPLVAEVEGEPVAAVIPFRFSGKAWYLYGMSFDAHRDKMPNYLLQWEAIRWAKELGCHRYDLWGAPDRFDPSDPLWGVYRFKDGFPASVVRTIGAWDFAPNPLRYQLYHRLLPPALSLMRFLGRRQTQRTARQESWDE